MKFNLGGQLHLLNMTKISQLYELYNFHNIVNHFSLLLEPYNFTLKSETTRLSSDELIDIFRYSNEDFKINIFYEKKYSIQSDIDLVRIKCDSSHSNYYRPDHIIEIFNLSKNTKNYWILDSKYSSKDNVKNRAWNECIGKYILNTGVYNQTYQKIEDLTLLFPKGSREDKVNDSFYKPSIQILGSSPSHSDELLTYISNIVANHIE